MACIIYEWLSGADDMLECASPHVDLTAIIGHVLAIAITHPDVGVRCEALRVLRNGIIEHSDVGVNLRGVAERLMQVSSDELLLSINVIGLSNDASLGEYVRPLLNLQETDIQTEARNCLAELGLPWTQSPVSPPPAPPG